MPQKFFAEQAEQSQIKSAIVTKYFWAWGKIILGHLNKVNPEPKIAYVDLFAGPGRYEDGKNSTPLMILETAIGDPMFCKSLVTIFNDKNANNTNALQAAIAGISGVDSLKYQPKVNTEEVGEEIVKQFEEMNLIPTLIFVDPWGYKGLSLRLINSVLKDWACECIFFFNYNRINMGLSNPAVKKHMEALFGVERAEELKATLEPLSADERELTIVEELCEALIEMGGKYTLPFRFRNEKGNRTSHHLIFVSKHPLGYKVMKQVMAGESSGEHQGVPTFEYNPATSRQRVLFDLARPLDDLEGMLLSKYSGKQITMGELFEEHNYGLPFIERNYKSVLLQMEIDGKVSTDRPYWTRKKMKGQHTFANDVVITFPMAKGAKP